MRLALSLGLLEEWRDAESAEMLPFLDGASWPELLGPLDGAALWLADGLKTAELLQRQGVPSVVVRPFPKKPERHIARHYADAVGGRFRIDPPEDLSELFPWRRGRRGGDVLIHPGSGSVKKNFPTDFYISLSEAIKREFNVETAFLIGPVELERPEMAAIVRTGRVIQPPDATELAGVLSKAGAFIGNDSGPAHLAGALGLDVVALHKTTSPKIWGAIGRGVSFVETDNAESARSGILQLLKRAML